MKPPFYIASLIIISVICLFGTSCKKDIQQPLNLSQENKWMLDSMKLYYYWNDQLPGKPANEMNKTNFFNSLLHADDRFSYVYDPDEIKTEYSSFAFYGFEYSFVTLPQFPGQLLGMVTLVVPGSTGFRVGLRRGDIFTAVNGQTITSSSSQNISLILKQGNGIQMNRVQINENQLIPLDNLNVPVGHFTENPVYLTKVFTSNNKKIGYLFYNYFDGAFDWQLLDSLGKLRSEGISELILDMRYNPGGDVSSAAKIVAALTPVNPDQLFVVYQANKYGGRTNSSFQQNMKENNFSPNDFATVKSYRLNLDRVTILTTSATASAAELVINCLKPFVSVTQIGQTTMGKDMGSFKIDDLREPKKINFVIHPLVFKLYNARLEGDYSKGIEPDYLVDEFTSVPLQPLGSMKDPLIQKALSTMGAVTVARSREFAASGFVTNSNYNSSIERSRHFRPVITKSKFLKVR